MFLTDRHTSRSAQRLDADETSPDHSSLDAAEMRMREALGLGGGQAASPRRDNAPARPPSEQPRAAQHRPMGGDRPNGNGHRHRFVQDGEVPVVLVSHAAGAPSLPANPRNNDARPAARGPAPSPEHSAERAARERAERQVQQAVAAIRDLETKLAHADIARMEAVNGAKADRAMLMTVREELRAQVAKLSEQLTAERAARELAESRLAAALAGEPLRWQRKPRAPRAERAATAEADAGTGDESPATDLTAPRKRGRPRLSSVEKAPRVSKRAAAEPKPVKWWVKPRAKA